MPKSTQLDEINITLKSLLKQINNRFDRQDKFNSQFHRDVLSLKKELNGRFDHQEKKFIDWKSELFTKIDSSYIKPIKDLQIDKLKSTL